MIKVIIEKNDSIINSLEVSGHSNYDEKGKDIVCAGVSAIVVGGINALIKTLQEFKKSYKIKGLFSVVKDKQSDLMIEKLIDNCDEVHVSEFDFYRAKKVEEIAANHQMIIDKDWKIAINKKTGFRNL